MTVMARNRTPAARAARRECPVPQFTHAELRERRQAGLLHSYGGGWSLTTEVAALCNPLAQRVAATPNPLGYIRYVDDLTDAVHQAVHVVVGLLAEADAQRRTRHLRADDRGRSIRALIDLATRPPAPQITDDMLCDGTWTATLMALVEPYSDDLARLLGNALTTVVSDRLLAVLRDVDHAVACLSRRLDRADKARAAKTTEAVPSTADRAVAELESLGVTL